MVVLGVDVARRKRLLDIQLDLIVNYAYCQPHPELPDSPKEAFECYLKLLNGRSADAH